MVVAGKDVNAPAKQAVVSDNKTIVAGAGDGKISSVAAEAAGTEKMLASVARC